jgi:hypothetical protein
MNITAAGPVPAIPNPVNVAFRDLSAEPLDGLLGARSAERSSLEIVTDNFSPPPPKIVSKLAERVAVNRRRFDYLRRESSVARQRGCMRTAVNGTALVLDRGGFWRCAGLMRCSRVECPSCGVVILTQRQDDIEAAADRWVRFHKGTLAFITLTFSHELRESFETNSEVRAAAWKSIGRGKAWAGDRSRFGVAGFIRVNEDTWGDKYGWHCHIHVLVFLRHEPGSKEATAAVKGLGASMFRRWGYSLVKTGRRMSRKAQKAQEVTGAEAAKAMGDYLTKQLDVPKRELGAAMAAEMVGARFKTAGVKVEGVHLSVTDLLDLAMAGDEDARELYNRRELALVGKRSISWSNGLRQLLGFPEDEVSDAVIAAEDDAVKRSVERVVFSIRQRDWSKLSRLRYGMGRMLELGESGGEDAAAAWLDSRGIGFTRGDPAADSSLAAWVPAEVWGDQEKKTAERDARRAEYDDIAPAAFAEQAARHAAYLAAIPF